MEMPHVGGEEEASLPQPPRLPPSRFNCFECKKIKRFCDKQLPVCGRCEKMGLECIYQTSGRGRPPRKKSSEGGPFPPLAHHTLPSPAAAFQLHHPPTASCPPPASSSHIRQEEEQWQQQQRHGGAGRVGKRQGAAAVGEMGDGAAGDLDWASHGPMARLSRVTDVSVGRRMDGAELSPSVERPIVSADEMRASLEYMCHGLSNVRSSGNIDPRKTKFIMDSLKFIYTISRQAFIFPPFLDLLGGMTQEGEARQWAKRTGGAGRRQAKPTAADMRAAGLMMMGAPGGWRQLKRERGLEWALELMETPGAAGICLCMSHFDRVGNDQIDQVFCNDIMSSTFISTQEVVEIAIQQRTLFPCVISRLMTRESIQAFYPTWCSFYTTDFSGEGNCIVQMRDRCGAWRRCFATTRWYWEFDRVLVVSRFCPMAEQHFISTSLPTTTTTTTATVPTPPPSSEPYIFGAGAQRDSQSQTHQHGGGLVEDTTTTSVVPPLDDLDLVDEEAVLGEEDIAALEQLLAS